MQNRNSLAASLSALGLAGAGWFAAQGMARLRTADRYVTVNGSPNCDPAQQPGRRPSPRCAAAAQS